jgi:outer membrane protein OmpA-like peptidoglycan-associated protein
MKKNKGESFFWMSFSDLMTSLFFIVLVLYVLTYIMLKKNQRELEVKQELLEIENERLNKILQLEALFEPLKQSPDYLYLPECKKYISKPLSAEEIFEPNKTQIKNEFIATTMNVGRDLEQFLKILHSQNPDFSYLIVIEGNMANSWDRKFSPNSNYGFTMSYQRALAVYNLWVENEIDLRQYNSEILICGSGFNGLCRDKTEENNKRFTIQIIPKMQNEN